MFELSEREIDLVSRDIDKQGLTYTLLKNEILDHLCCQVEDEMENGMTFNEAYQKVKERVGQKRIRQIQDETLYLINTKYRRMKKTMYGLGITIPILLMTGILFKVMHWPGAALILSVGIFAMAIFFLPLFVMVRIRDTRSQEESVPMGLYIAGLIGGIATMLGSLLKIQHMPGASVLISLGLFTLAAVFLPMYAVVRIRIAKEKDEDLNRWVLISGVIAGILFLAGALFKSMHWPGAGYVLIISWLMVALLLLPVLALNILKQQKNRLNNFFFVIVVLSILSVLILLQVRSNEPQNAEMQRHTTESAEPG